jgi:hypothetical protein
VVFWDMQWREPDVNVQVCRQRIKSYKPISRILSWAIIYLSQQLPEAINLPTLDRDRLSTVRRRAVCNRSCTWHFSMQGLPAKDVTIIGRELLPHVFNLTAIIVDDAAVIFCGTISSRLSPEAGSSPVHCSVLSGLSFPRKAER